MSLEHFHSLKCHLPSVLLSNNDFLKKKRGRNGKWKLNWYSKSEAVLISSNSNLRLGHLGFGEEIASLTLVGN